MAYDETLALRIKAELQTRAACRTQNVRRSAFMIGGTMYCCVTDTARRTREYTSTLPILSHHPWGRLQPYE